MEANNDITKKNKVYPKDASDNNIPKQENSYNHLLYHIIKTRNINFIKNYFWSLVSSNEIVGVSMIFKFDLKIRIDFVNSVYLKISGDFTSSGANICTVRFKISGNF